MNYDIHYCHRPLYLPNHKDHAYILISRFNSMLPYFQSINTNCMKKEQLTDEQKCANSKLKINYSNKADAAHACSSYTDVCFTITAHTHASTSKGTFLFFSFENKLCVPHLGMLSRSSLTNSPSRLASRLHVTRASHVHGSDSSSSSSSSLSNHF